VDTYIILADNDGLIFEGTLAQADDTFGIAVGCTEADLIAFVRTTSLFPKARLFKLVAQNES
jgi:hypothetical protein